jgi:adenosylhomocysteine nucleosidase
MDARPLMAQFEIPLLGKTYFETKAPQLSLAKKAVESFLQQHTIPLDILTAFNITNPKVHVGDIASGDQFIAAKNTKHALQKNLPSILCVEMEGAALAQVCDEFNVPFTIIRTISDSADHEAHLDFPKFINAIASKYAVGILQEYYKLLTNS